MRSPAVHRLEFALSAPNVWLMRGDIPMIQLLSAEADPRIEDPRYLAFFDCFNGHRFFEAHEVLEELWLEVKHGGDGDFYKGLIQLAAAFLHWREGRPGPAAALLRTARGHLAKYPPLHHRLPVAGVLGIADEWVAQIEGGLLAGQALPREVPRIELCREQR